ncbi:hypothetical protein HCN44_000424 [Aphidius gifuensis]|uniref:Centromere protein J n=1 Tax=Aphidius gifuensis TaxID=684658 RepID=A0A835CPG9_APHGI|nr:uncharacterized protein PFB0145c [Aphidius gifuensis]KAF7990619.1 hypothetical protein HCN44_000424 [Aphidius gifuensis]
METEASIIIERLKILKKWQTSRQELLLQQQKEQRESLSKAYERTFEDIRLSIENNESVNDEVLTERHLSLNSDVNNNSLGSSLSNDNKSVIEISNLNDTNNELDFQLSAPQVFLRTVSDKTDDSPNEIQCDIYHLPTLKYQSTNEPETMFLNESKDTLINPSNNKILIIDDIPLPSLNKDFKTLLDEKLKVSEPSETNKVVSNKTNQVKQPFLRKGQGLARFRSNGINKISKNKNNNNNSIKSKCNYLPNSQNVETQISYVNGNKNKKISNSSSLDSKPDLNIPQLKYNADVSNDKTGRTPQSNYNNVNISRSDDSRQSDMDSSRLETREFEMLEEKVENSSFGSTSSTYIAFMQSTPLKTKNLKKQLSSHHVVMSSSIDEDCMDAGILNQSTPKIKISHSKRKKNSLQNDYLLSQLGSCSFLSNEMNENGTILRDIHDGIKTMVEQKANHRQANELETSMHVRFAEHNDYKTIRLNDTSILSNDYETSQMSYNDSSSDQSDSSQCSQLLAKSLIENSNNNSFHNYVDELSDHTTDDENSTLNNSFRTNYYQISSIKDVQNPQKNIYDITQYSKQIDDNEIDNKYQFKKSDDEINEIVFKSDLLKSRLLELEHEINIFRKENASLSIQRQKWYDERIKTEREFKLKEKQFIQKKIELEEQIQDEKKRLMREKVALENRIRDAKERCQLIKHEHEENQLLKKQFEELKNEFDEKERRWKVSQGQQRSQLRVLQMENLNLKQELQILQDVKRCNGKSKKYNIPTNTKAIHQINKLLDGKTSSSPNKDILEKKHESKETKKNQSDINLPSNINYDAVIDNNNEKIIIYEHLENYKHKNTRDLDEEEFQANTEKINHVVDDFTDDDIKNIQNSMPESETNEINTHFSDAKTMKESIINKKMPHMLDSISSKDCNSEVKSWQQKSRSIENLDRQSPSHGTYQQFVRKVINSQNDATEIVNNTENHFPLINLTKNHHEELMKPLAPMINHKTYTTVNSQSSPVHYDHENYRALNKIDQHFTLQTDKLTVNQQNYVDSDYNPRKEIKPLPRPSEDMTPRPDPVQVSHLSYMLSPGKSELNHFNPQDVRIVEHPDHINYWYPNGSLKKVYPDKNIIKLIYNNGDVRETLADGCVKYYYAASNTWHITYLNGFEFIEFSNGQQERRDIDGTVEVSFADGSKRLIKPNGEEKWTLADKTIAETFPNGDKILTLPNGQREIHTKDHKRREYADGTVKYVYPDGSQETRYSSGRVRKKDKDGNLIMDSYQPQR